MHTTSLCSSTLLSTQHPMSDTEQQSFQAWLRGHFRFDSNDLAEISNLIAVPGLPDVDMPDVLSLLAEEDGLPQPSSSHGGYPQSRTSLDSTAVLPDSGVQWPADLADETAPQQFTAEVCWPPAGDAHGPAFVVPQGGLQLQPDGNLQSQQAALYSSQQQPRELLQAPQNQFGCTPAHDQNAALYSQAEIAANPYVAAPAYDARSGLPANTGTLSSFAGFTMQDLYSAQPQAGAPAAGPLTMPDPALSMQQPGPLNTGRVTSSGEFDISQSSSQSHGHGTKHTRQSTAGKHPAGIRVASRRISTATAADAGGQEGVVKRRKRKPSDAQRAAHRRFRQRRKEQMSTLEQEVAAKQAQLQALSMEHMALKAKARALDQLVASAGDGMALLQQLEQLSISQKEQQQQQQQLSVSTEDQQLPALASAVTTEADTDCLTSAVGLQLQQLQPSTSGSYTSTPSSPEEKQQQQQLEHEQLVQAGSMGGSLNSICCGDCSAGLKVQPQANRVNTAGSIEHLEARLKSILTLPTYDPVKILHDSDSMRVQDKLPKLRTLLKSFIREVMQLMLQIGQETGQGSSLGFQAWPEDGLLQSLTQKPQPPPKADLGLLLQQQALGSHQASAAVAAATGSDGNVSESPAYARLLWLLAQTNVEFRKFAHVNRISLYHAHTLNLETGSLGVPPPPGHWKRVAMLLKNKLPQQALSDVCVARQLYCNAVCSVTHQRHMLFMELQRLLDKDGTIGYRTLQVMEDLHGIHGQGVAILDAIDHNMRKEFTLEGVFQWMVRKLVSPLLSAEILVHSYPYIPDFHCVLSELVQISEQVPALTALQELQLQQFNSMGGGEQQQQQQQTQMLAAGYDTNQQQNPQGQNQQLREQQRRPGLPVMIEQQQLPAAVMRELQAQVDATWQGQQAPVEVWQQAPHQQPVVGWQGQQHQQQQLHGTWQMEQLLPGVTCQDASSKGVEVLQ